MASTVGSLELIPVRQAATVTGLSEWTIRRYIQQGILRRYQVGQRAVRVDADEVHALITSTGDGDR